MPQISHLECSRCHNSISADTPQTLCPQCAGALYVRYELSSAQGTAVRDRIASEAARMRSLSRMFEHVPETAFSVHE